VSHLWLPGYGQFGVFKKPEGRKGSSSCGWQSYLLLTCDFNEELWPDSVKPLVVLGLFDVRPQGMMELVSVVSGGNIEQDLFEG